MPSHRRARTSTPTDPPLIAPLEPRLLLSGTGFVADAPPESTDLGAKSAGALGVVDRHVFYDGSAADGQTGPGASDDQAIDPSAEARLPGEAPAGAHVTGAVQGLNGVMVDIAGLASAGAETAVDYAFHVADPADPSQWIDAPAPSASAVRPGAGTDGSDRVTFTWANDAIVGQWLRVTVTLTRAGSSRMIDVFTLGNLPGDANGDRVVDVGDLGMLASRWGDQDASVPMAADFNVDGIIDVGDLGILASSWGGTLAQPANDAPTIASDLPESIVLTDELGYTVGIDGADADGDALSIDVISSQPGLLVHVPEGNRFARLRFVEEDLTTPAGEILVELFESRSTPATDRFITLATTGFDQAGQADPSVDPFYTDVLVHRAIPQFMIQMGDAANGDGTGGSPLGTFDDVFDPVLSFAGPGALAMANSGPDTNDSQFFITEVPTTWLNHKHMIFGQIVTGAELVESIAQRSGTGSSPTPPVYLAGVEVIDSPQDGSLTIWAPDGWEGEATVTVQVTDPSGQTSEQQIDVLALGEPPEPVGELLIPAEPGVQGTASLPVVDGGGLDASVQVLCDDPNLDWTYDQATGEFTYTLAADFTGAVDVRFLTIETAYEDSDREPGVHHVIVYSAGENDPEVLSRIDTTDAQGRPLAPLTVMADGNRLYVGMYYKTDYDVAHALHVYDLADSSSPALLGTYALPAGDTWAQEIVIDGDVAYLAARGAGLIALDVSDPADMVPLGIGAGDPFAAGDLDLVGDTLYVAAFYEGLLAFDVSDPAAIARIGQLTPYGGGNSISHVAVYGTTALVAEGRGLVSVNITDPASMTYSAVEYDTTGVTVLAGEANRLYALDDTGQLLIFNVSSGNPTLAGTHAVDPASWNLSFDVYDVLMANNSGMQYLNTGDAANVQQWLDYEVSQFTGRPLRDGDLMYLPTWNAGVLVLDITPIL